MMSPLYVERLVGKGPHLLMLHGWGHTHRELRPLAELLAHRFSVSLVDLPGFGQSSIPKSVWGAYDYADRLIAHLDEEGIKTTHLFGHSFGGKVAMALAARYPDRVDRVVLLNASGHPLRRTAKQAARVTAIRYANKLFRAWGSGWIGQRYGSSDYQAAGPMKDILVRSVNESLSQDIGKVQADTLLMWGEKDTETPVESGRQIHAMLPNSQLVTFPERGHNLFLDAGHHLCARHMLPFLQEAT
jgi:pimeloyl-ACP methyl ester carboxylesterase